MTFKEISPFIIIATIVICTIIARKIKKRNILSIDGIFSTVGFGLGLIITFLNLRYSNNYLITLGPLLAIASLLYLRLKDKILVEKDNILIERSELNSKSKTLVVDIIYWICVIIGLISYQQAHPYNRPIIFFICISINVTLIAVEIFNIKYEDKLKITSVIFKMLFLSLILRASEYFISPYPLGSDPWGHADYIKDIITYTSLSVPQTFTSAYYIHYPLMHIYACIVDLVEGFNVKESMFFISIILTLSSIFVYLLAKKIIGNTNIALLSMLLINFTDISIQWSIEIIAMSLGIAYYTILIYLLVKINDEKNKVKYKSLIIMYIFIVTWTHTISLFIVILSISSLYIGQVLYDKLYKDGKFENSLVRRSSFSSTLIIVSIVIMFSHWSNPDYPFLEKVTRGLIESLTSEVKFLDKITYTNIGDSWELIFNIFGFLASIFFGIIGCLCFLSRKHANKTSFSLIFMITTLFFIYFIFPVIGLKNIIPSRWPPFIYMSFILFVGFGFFNIGHIFTNKNKRNIFVAVSIFAIIFINIISPISNMESPLLGGKTVPLFWKESEMKLCGGVNEFYDGIITTDIQTAFGPLETYYRNNQTRYFRYTSEEKVDYNYMNDTLIIWRQISLSRPITFDTRPRRSSVLLGTEFKDCLDRNYINVYDTGGARAYLNI